MRVTNVHRRTIPRPISSLAPLLATLATKDDRIWPAEKWPAMRFQNGLSVGNRGGHGPIRYTVTQQDLPRQIEFRFSKPRGFHGVHRLDVHARGDTCELVHTIDIRIGLLTFPKWFLVVRPLHNALIEDAFDKVENQFGQSQLTPWSWWVKVLRRQLA